MQKYSKIIFKFQTPKQSFVLVNIMLQINLRDYYRKYIESFVKLFILMQFKDKFNRKKIAVY